MARLTMPLLVIRGADDKISTPRWAEELSRLVDDGELAEVAGPHTFIWVDPHAWSQPLRRLALRSAGMTP